MLMPNGRPPMLMPNCARAGSGCPTNAVAITKATPDVTNQPLICILVSRLVVPDISFSLPAAVPAAAPRTACHRRLDRLPMRGLHLLVHQVRVGHLALP